MLRERFHSSLYSNYCTDEADLDTVALVSVLTVLKSADPKDAFWYLAATGDVLTLESYLQRFPDEVCTIAVCVVCMYVRIANTVESPNKYKLCTMCEGNTECITCLVQSQRTPDTGAAVSKRREFERSERERD